MAGCADQVKRVTLELGGKSSNIVFADADIAAAAAAARRTPSSTTPARTAAPARGSWCERSAYDEFVSPARARRAGGAGARPVGPDGESSEMGPLISARQQRAGHRLPRRGRGRVRRHRARAATASGCRPPWSPSTTRAADLARGGLRPGRGGDGLRRRGRRRGPGQRHRLRPVRLDLHPRPRPRPAGRPRGARRATSASTPTRRCATGRRSAATSSPASAASSGPTPPLASPRRRTSSSPTEAHPPGTTRRADDHHGRTRSRTGSRSSPAGARASAWPPSSASSPRAPRSSSATSTTQRGARARRPSSAATECDVRARRRHRQGAGRRPVPDREGHLRLRSTSPSTTPASARPRTTRSSTPTSRPGAGCRRST